MACLTEFGISVYMNLLKSIYELFQCFHIHLFLYIHKIHVDSPTRIYHFLELTKVHLYDRRAKTHERFYMIEVHRHRFARHARKVPFEKCEHWRKVCGRSAKDQIASTL